MCVRACVHEHIYVLILLEDVGCWETAWADSTQGHLSSDPIAATYYLCDFVQDS